MISTRSSSLTMLSALNQNKPIRSSDMDDFEKCELAFDILEYAEVVEPDGDQVVIKVNKEMWNKFLGIN